MFIGWSAVYDCLAIMGWDDVILYLIIMAVTTGIAYALRPKPPKTEAAGINELNLPTCEQGTPYAVIYGTPPRFKGQMILWYGSYYARKTNSGSYEYHMTFLFGLSHANLDGIIQLWAEDYCVWPYITGFVPTAPTIYAADGETFLNYSAASRIWGGPRRGGGVGGGGTVMYGESTQEVNALVQAQLGTPCPAFRGITTFWIPGYWGVSPQFPILSFVAKRVNKLHEGGAQWYIAKAPINTYDLNAVHIIREAMTSSVCGNGMSTALINEASFEAAADVCFAEGIGLSYRYIPGQDTLADFIHQIEQIANMAVYFDHSAGQYKIQMIRQDYDPNTLDTYTEDDFDILEFHRPVYNEVPSQTIVWYMDRLSAKKAPASDDDAALADIQGGRPIVQEFTFLQICGPVLALSVASRFQKYASSMSAALNLSAKRTMYNLHRGSVFKITHPKLLAGGVASMTVRVVSINRGTLENGQMTISVAEDVFGDAPSTNASNPASGWTEPVMTEVDMDESITVTFDSMQVNAINESVS